MRNDSQEEFDLKLRSLLYDAAEEVPSGVWESLSGRIAPARRTTSPWVWTGIGLALAACTCATLLLIGRPEGLQKPSPADATALVDIKDSRVESSPVNDSRVIDAPAPETDLIAQAATVKEQPRAADDLVAHAGRGIAAAAAGASDGDIPATEEKTGSAATAEETIGKVAAAEAPSASVQANEQNSTNVSGESKKADGKVRDAFAQMAFEDAAEAATRARLSSINISGNIGANENVSNNVSHYSIGRANPGAQETINETSISQYGIPVTLSAGVRFYLIPRLSIGTGLNVSLLSRSFSGEYTPVGEATVSGDIRHTMFYLGVPVNVAYDLISNDVIKFYAFGQAAAEWCLSNKYTILATTPATVVNDPVKGVQASIGAGLGIEFRLSKLLGLYFNPGVNYYFNCNHPKNVRSDHPALFSVDAGLRFNL